MKSESQLDKNLRKLISAVHPVQSQPEFKRELLNKLVHLVKSRKQTTDCSSSVRQTLWRHPGLYMGISAAAVLLIAFLFIHVEKRAPCTFATVPVKNGSESVCIFVEKESINKMAEEIKRQSRPDLYFKPPRQYGWDIKSPRPCGWDIKPPRPCG